MRIKAGNYEDGYENYAHINDVDDCVDVVKYFDKANVIEKEKIYNKMNKKLVICILASLMLFTGCGATNNNKVRKNNNDKYGITDYKDPETGVHYLIYDDRITVRYNADGTIMVD